jgi:predicted TIM-barrel fold metal-dependent hydrolase
VIVDVNISLSQWPTRRLPLDDTRLLADELLRHQVTQAWASTFDAILHNDIAAANERLASECRSVENDLLQPVGAINPGLPNWEDDVKRCDEFFGMLGVRLLPGYHNYSLDDPRFAQLLMLAKNRKMFVQIAVRQEDPRTQHPLLSVKDVDLKPLLPLLSDFSDIPIILLNALSSSNSELHGSLAAAGQVWFDIATLEGLAGLERQIRSLPAERILFGSHSPFFVFDAARFKLQESELPAPVIEQISHSNAGLLLKQLRP